MWQTTSDGITYLLSQSGESLFRLFWFVALFELPRYSMGFLSVAALSLRREHEKYSVPSTVRVSVVIAGHNEEDSIERCVQSLHEQSRPPDEIIVVSDGSVDRMPERLRGLVQQNLIKEAHCTQMRAGKSAAANLAIGRTTGDVIVNVDCDCTFDRLAIQQIIEPLSEPRIGAVSGNILVRNSGASLMTTFQSIEYMISISQGKQASDLTGQVSCVSGAFGAFRSSALDEVGGLDAGGGEDLDITLRLRKAGWKTAFAANAICYTDVPVTFSALARQRFRWERDAVRLRYRKHRDLLNPFSHRFRMSELAHEADFFVFNILSAVVFPIYLVWLFATYGDMAVMILVGAQGGMLVLDAISFLLAAFVTPRVNALRLAPYLPGYSLFNGLIMRFIRLGAYLQEWILLASYRDTYVPQKVNRVRR
jgi:cellulose synthase/poly-beta-1,6-N-acetylglucosamine synthase-like glycosyltransferase